jgi:transcriptional regulator with XRE-family HTH domain
VTRTKGEIAGRIKRARLRKGLSQAACAELVGVSRMMWLRYERGDGMPSGGNAERLAELLEIPVALFAPSQEGPSRDVLALAQLLESMVNGLADARVNARLAELSAVA